LAVISARSRAAGAAVNTLKLVLVYVVIVVAVVAFVATMLTTPEQLRPDFLPSLVGAAAALASCRCPAGRQWLSMFQAYLYGSLAVLFAVAVWAHVSVARWSLPLSVVQLGWVCGAITAVGWLVWHRRSRSIPDAA
jgi:hypothetical protein